MPYGYMGKVLRVNLSDRTTTVEEPGDDWYRKYMGGTAVVAYYLLNEVPADCDPLGPENKIIFATGPMTGTPLAGSGRNSVGAKSPLSGGFGDAQGGGWWMVELKKAGFDHIVLEGAADAPVYLWIDDGEVEIRDAERLWGRDTGEVEDLIREELGDDRIRITQCGIAGENLVRFACVVNDLTHFPGRTGVGAVMGSKKLRAIAVRGTGEIPVADSDEVTRYARMMNRAVASGERSAGMKDTGTPATVTSLNVMGGLPTRNFQEGQFEGAEAISGQTLRDTLLVDRDNCHACPIYCKRVVGGDKYGVDPRYGGPEYETLGSLGSNCGIDDLEAVCKGNDLCNRWGLDTISCGMTISFVMECYERGVLKADDLDGLEAGFGNAEAMLELIEKIAHREGVGDLLAEGSARAAEQLGPQAEPLSINVKRQELPMHEPRLKHALGVGYTISPTGADHNHNLHDTAYVSSADALDIYGVTSPLPADDLSGAKVRMLYCVSTYKHMQNCAIMCYFVSWSVREFLEITRAVTGWDTSVYDLLKIGERAATMARLFNLRCGFNDRDDALNKRFSTPFTSGPIAGTAIDPKVLDEARLTYYHMMGWDDLGRPTQDRLVELGIEWLND
ncbi:MAG: aldehyde ferredoxin oxidoreductase family protein [Bacillota bacterium]